MHASFFSHALQKNRVRERLVSGNVTAILTGARAERHARGHEGKPETPRHHDADMGRAAAIRAGGQDVHGGKFRADAADGSDAEVDPDGLFFSGKNEYFGIFSVIT